MAPEFRPIDYSLSFVLPQRLTDVASWHEHAPFAFALMTVLRPRLLVELGTHRGDSYGVFCQAVAELSLETRCFAVDTWRGDEHSGLYGDEVLEELRAYHDPRYGLFSTLLRSTFDEACHGFADGSIELLHVDGLHTEEAVRHDFENWLPKLGPRAVALFHDTSVRERGFGVWRFWSDVSNRYPSFEFSHGNGLGVLAVGRDVPAEILRLCGASTDLRRRFAGFYEALGARVLLAGRAQQQGRRLAALKQALTEKERTIAERDDALAHKDRVMADRDRALADKDRALAERDAQLQNVSASLAEITAELSRLTRSRSWRYSAPLRQAAAIARRVRDEGPRGLVVALPRMRRSLPSKVHEGERAFLASGALNRAWYGGVPLDVPAAGSERAGLETRAARIDREDTRAIIALTAKPGADGDPSGHGGAPSNSVRSLAPLEEIARYLASVSPESVPARPGGPPSFTIVTPFFRHRAYLDACAASVDALRQRSEGLALEWLLISDDPDYQDADLERAVPEALRPITRILSGGRRLGIVRRLNQGIAEARHEWILFLDCDDLIHSDALGVLRRWIERFPRCRYISSAMVDIDEKDAVLRYRRRTSGPAHLLAEGMTAGHLKAIRRDAFEHHGFLDEGFAGCQDYEFALRLAFEEPILYVPEYLYSYRWHQSSQSVAEGARQTTTADAVVRHYALRYLRHPNGGGVRPEKSHFAPLPRRAAAIVRTQGTRPDFLLEALESLRLQTFPVRAIVVVHGDETAANRVRATVARSGGEVEVLHAPDTGRRRGHPVNVGLRHLYRTGTDLAFVFFLDDDDIVYPLFAERMREALIETGADLVHAASNRRVPGKAAERGYVPLPAPCLLVDNFIPINAYAVRFSTAREQELTFDESLEVLEDWSFLVRALGEGLRFSPVDETLSEFRIIGDGNRPRKKRPAIWASCRDQIRREVDHAYQSLGRAALLEQFLMFPSEALEVLPASNRRLVVAARRLVDEKCPVRP